MSIKLRFFCFFVLGGLAAFFLIGLVFSTGVALDYFKSDAMPINGFALTVVFAVLFVASLGLFRAAVTILGKPMAQIIKGVEQILDGNLSPELPPNAPAEFGQISNALETCCGQMRMIMAQLSSLSERVIESTDNADGSLGELGTVAKTQAQVAMRSFDTLKQFHAGLNDSDKVMKALAKRVVDSDIQVAEAITTVKLIAETVGNMAVSVDQLSNMSQPGDAKALSNELDELSSSVGNVRRALNEMMDDVQKARNSAYDSSEIIRRLETETMQIGAAIKDVIRGSDAVHDSNERILQVTANLESRVDGMDNVIDVISNLAERTKLLSINASIIASEAGEHGRAFAVVAHEVKDLAQSTAGAISEISRVVSGLKSGFSQTVETIHSGQEDIDQGVKTAKNAVELLQSIPGNVSAVASCNEEVVGRIEHQVSRGQQVEQIIGRVTGTLGQVGQMFSEQISRTERSITSFHNIGLVSDQVTHSIRGHATSINDIGRAMERLNSDIGGLSEQLDRQVAKLGDMLSMSENMMSSTENSRRKSDALSTVIGDLNRYALYLGEDFRKIGSS